MRPLLCTLLGLMQEKGFGHLAMSELKKRRCEFLSSGVVLTHMRLRGEAGATVLGIRWRPLRQTKVALGEMGNADQRGNNDGDDCRDLWQAKSFSLKAQASVAGAP